MDNINRLFLECNGLMRIEESAVPELVAELKELTRHSTIQDIEIATELFKSLLKEDSGMFELLLGSVFFAGEIMGIRSERAKKHRPTEEDAVKTAKQEAQELDNTASDRAKAVFDLYAYDPVKRTE